MILKRMRLVWHSLLVSLFFGFVGPSKASQISEVDVTALGFGSAQSLAIQDALTSAIAQVNGEAIAASIKLKETTTTASSVSSGDSRSIERKVEEEIDRKTKGVVRAWKVLSVEKTETGDFSATVSASIVVLQRSVQLERVKLAVVNSKSALQPFVADLNASLVGLLSSSRKFAVMDRKNSEAVEDQLERIRKGGGQISDQVRLTAEVAPDLLVVVNVEESVGREGKKNLFGSIDIIDYSTRQVRFSDRKIMIIDPAKPSAAKVRISTLAKMLSRSVIETAFPPTVIGVADRALTIGQGADFFSVGDSIVVYELGKELRDPHTQEFLAFERKELAVGTIVYTDARISQGRLDKPVPINQAAIAAKKIQVSRRLNELGSTGSPQSARKNPVSSIFDEKE